MSSLILNPLISGTSTWRFTTASPWLEQDTTQEQTLQRNSRLLGAVVLSYPPPPAPPPPPIVIDDPSLKNAAESFTVALTLT